MCAFCRVKSFGIWNAFVLALLVLSPDQARGDDLIWTGQTGTMNDGNWTASPTDLNWITMGIPTYYTGGDNVTFDDTAQGTTTITIQSAGVSPGSIAVSNSVLNYTIMGGPIQGATSLSKDGTATLTLGGQNTYTGGTNFTQGTLALAVGSTQNGSGSVISGPVGTGTLSIGSASGPVTLITQGSSQTLGNLIVVNGNVNFSGGDLTLTDPEISNGGFETLTVKKRNETITIDGKITEKDPKGAPGGIRIDARSGTVELNSDESTFRRGVILLTGTLSIGDNTKVTGGVITGPLGSGTLTLGNAVAGNKVTLTAGPSAVTIANPLKFNSNGGTVVFNSNLVFTAATNTVVAPSGGSGTMRFSIGDRLPPEIEGNITGAEKYTLFVNAAGKMGMGILVLDGKNSFGGMTIGNVEGKGPLGGTVIATRDGALGTGSGKVTVNSGATLGLQGTFAYNTAQDVTLNDTGAGGLGALRCFKMGNGMGSDVSFKGNITLASNSYIGVDADSRLVLTGVISGANTLGKVGSGILRLDNANTYSGGTAIAAGTLNVNNVAGSATGTDVVIIGPTATLRGTGKISGLVINLFGSDLRPGNSPGVLTLNGGLQMDSGSRLDIEIDGANPGNGAGYYSQALVSQGTTLEEPTLNVILDAPPVRGAEYDILRNADNMPISGTFMGLNEGAIFDVTSSLGTYLFEITYFGGNDIYHDGSDNDVVLTALTGVPEPPSFVMLGVGALAMSSVYFRQRRK